MKNLLSVLNLIGLLVLAGCTYNSNGLYKVTAIEPRHIDADLEDALIQKMSNTEYNLKFDNKGLEMKSVKTNILLTLPKRAVYGPRTEYATSVKRHDTTYSFSVTKDSLISLVISVFPPEKPDDRSPFGSDGSINNVVALSHGYPKAEVTCYLTKQ